jgi:hypothetical protein
LRKSAFSSSVVGFLVGAVGRFVDGCLSSVFFVPGERLTVAENGLVALDSCEEDTLVEAFFSAGFSPFSREIVSLLTHLF